MAGIEPKKCRCGAVLGAGFCTVSGRQEDECRTGDNERRLLERLLNIEHAERHGHPPEEVQEDNRLFRNTRRAMRLWAMSAARSKIKVKCEVKP